MPAEMQPIDTSKKTLRKVALASYALLTLGVLALTIFLARLAAAPLEEPPPPTITLRPVATLAPSATASPTSTSTPTQTPLPSATPGPTATATNTSTPTATATRTLVPSLTLAFPIAENERYELAEFTPALIHRGIELLQAYPESLSAYHRGADNAGYFAAFEYAELFQREALLRLPTSLEADSWLWKLAYNQARTGNPNAGVAYTTLINQAFNAGNVQVDGLYGWGVSLDPQMIVEAFPLETNPGLLGNDLIRVSDSSENGSAYLWLVQTPNGFEAYPLTSDFDFIHPTLVNHFTSDLTGDGNAEVVIYRSAIPGASEYLLPRVFDLSKRPPLELPIETHPVTEIGLDFDNQWEPVEDPTEQADLQFTTTVFPACPITVRHLFDWNGQSFTYAGGRYSAAPDPNLLGYCEAVIDHAARSWGLETAIHLMESLTPSWPPLTKPDGDPYPQDALDEWRYRLGIYYGLAGRYEDTIASMRAIITNPAALTSRWIMPAEGFLTTYQTQRDIYRACLGASFCDPRLALQALVATFSSDDYASAQQILQESGVTIRSSGFFDFDGDLTTEHWFVLRHQPLTELEFWILAQIPSGVEALFVAEVETSQPRVESLEPVEATPITQIEPDITFIVHRQPTTGRHILTFVTPTVEFSVDRTRQSLDQVQEDLLSGADPFQMRAELLSIREAPFFTCNYLLCPQYFYLLGLANELAGNERDAIDAYLELWRQYPNSPQAIPARLKLLGEAIVPSRTPLGTATRTITPTPTGAPLRTSTPTQTGTPATPTPTHTGTPPTLTPSRTASATLPGYPP